MGTWGRGLAALVVGVGCSGSEDTDGGAFLACRAFRETAADYETLTATELRDRLADIDDDAEVADDADVRESARAMIVAATSGTDDELATAVLAMGEACDRLEL